MSLLNREPASPVCLAPTIIGSSDGLRQVLAIAMRVAPGGAKVLLTGESGVGKDVVARFIHSQSARATRPFVALNCAGIAESLLESELFGHVKGSFTGAYRDKVGSLALANRGTIFLDEIGDMSLRMQALLLRFLETGEIQPVGSDSPVIRVDVRIISATNRNLAKKVESGEFREDLLYRINVVHIDVPPLRERVEDIDPLVQYFLEQRGVSLTVSDEAMRLLEQYRWPGNLRQLQNVVEQLASLVSERTVEPADLPPAIRGERPLQSGVRRERRRTVADELHEGLVSRGLRFWDDVHSLFTDRDITRADLRRLIRKGLSATSGSYRGLLQLFGIEQRDYKRLLNFLAAHDCMIDAREFRHAHARPESKGTTKRQPQSAAR